MFKVKSLLRISSVNVELVSTFQRLSLSPSSGVDVMNVFGGYICTQSCN
jgi:hypothetical protein